MEDTKIKFIGREKTLSTLGCSEGFLFNLVKSKKLTPKKLGRKVYYSVDEINRLIDNDGN
jgi:hypothetical protein